MALLGYARVSTLEQDPALQHDALTTAGCERVFSDRVSGALDERVELARVLEYAREGDTMVVWRQDRLGSGCRSCGDAAADGGAVACAVSPRWLASLAPVTRRDRGRRRFPDEMVELIEGHGAAPPGALDRARAPSGE